MKKILIVIATSGMFIPTIALAELNYNMFGVNIAKTSASGTADTKGYQFGISKDITSNAFLDGVYQTANQPSDIGDISISSFSVGAGYHTPIQENVDLIFSGDLMQAKATLADSSVTGNGFDFGVGVRAELTPIIEGILSGVYTHNGVNTNTVRSIAIIVELGFKVTPIVELHAGMTSESNSPSYGSNYPSQTLSFGARFYF